MDIKETFLKLTKYTYPHGTEHFLEKFLPKGARKDKYGNYFIKIGSSDTMFTCHLDTACENYEKVKHVIHENIIMTDGESILGADDKAGMTVLLYLISKGVPGLYYFFIGEEVGCIGSSKASANFDFTGINRCISFDRRGYFSVITHQLGERCCSDEFARKLAKSLSINDVHFYTDSSGVYTDSAEFVNIIPECTNISVGYFNEHTYKEHQDIRFLEKLCLNCESVKWDELPISRKINTLPLHSDDNDDDNDGYSSAKIKMIIDGDIYVVTLKKKRVEEEADAINNWVYRSGSYFGYSHIKWDGKSCYIIYEDDDNIAYNEYIGERDELIYVVDKLNDLPTRDVNIIGKVI